VPTPNAPFEAAVDRFRLDCDVAGPVLGQHRIGVAVSGGPDSLALLLLAAHAFPGRVEAATVDHGLRPESAREAQFVADICTQVDIDHVILTLPSPLPRGNVSAHLRELRYILLRDWSKERRLDWLMTGHHADDQLETVMMRLNRGAGVGGLSAIRRKNQRTIRPLLGWRRADLAALVAGCGIEPIEDPSNLDDRYDRARLRKALAGADWLDPLAVVRAAAAFDEADEALTWSASHWAKLRVKTDGAALTLDPANLPAELLRRILLACLCKLNPRAKPSGPKLSRLHATLRAGRKATLDGVAFDGRRMPWTISVAPPRTSATS
jgi:tRNA(Ile)-lysidine synthase